MGQRIGYARVSTDDQNLDLQLDALHKAGIGDDRLYSDTASGKDAERKELAACLKALREGDTPRALRAVGMTFQPISESR